MALTKDDLKKLGIDVDGAQAQVAKLKADHVARYPKDAKPHPLPDEKILAVANKTVKGTRDKLEAMAIEALAVLLKKAVE